MNSSDEESYKLGQSSDFNLFVSRLGVKKMFMYWLSLNIVVFVNDIVAAVSFFDEHLYICAIYIMSHFYDIIDQYIII